LSEFACAEQGGFSGSFA